MTALAQRAFVEAPVAVLEVGRSEANRLLVDWGHYLGPCNRPFGQEHYVLVVGEEPVSLAVSASTVSSTCAGQPRNTGVELARLCSRQRWATRVMLRLWREALAPLWPHWPITAAVAYSQNDRHDGRIYRFDGWTRVGDRAGSSGGGVVVDATRRRTRCARRQDPVDVAVRRGELVVTVVMRGTIRALPLRDESVDLIVTSPPYWSQRSYTDGGEHFDGQIGCEETAQLYLEALWTVMHECWRVLKPTGSAFVNMGDKRSGSGAPGTTSGLSPKDSRVQGDRSGMTARIKRYDRVDNERRGLASNGRVTRTYGGVGFGRKKSKMLLPHRFAIGCEDGLADPEGGGWVVRQDNVWWKSNGLPESTKDRTRDAHEYWFHLTKEGDYFADIDEIREPTKGYERFRNAARATPTGQRPRSMSDTTNEHGSLPPSVWRVATEPLTVPEYLDVEHFAAFPSEWPRRLISAFCPVDGVVLDPFGGTGTTAMVARALDRIGISVELSADYCRLAQWRIFDSTGASKVRQRRNQELQGAML